MKSFLPAPLPPPALASLESASERRSLAVPRFLWQEARSREGAFHGNARAWCREVLSVAGPQTNVQGCDHVRILTCTTISDGDGLAPLRTSKLMLPALQ